MQNGDLPLIPLLVEVLAYIMLGLAFMISIGRSVRQMIPLYQAQSIMLALVTVLTALEIENGGFPRLPVLPFTIIPLLLAWMIQPMLAQATVPADVTVRERLRRLFSPRFRQEVLRMALPSWLEHRSLRSGSVVLILLDLILMVLAFVIAFSLIEVSRQASILAITLSLLLLGLTAMANKQDIISQIMGLLVMEQGMFLAAIQVLAIPSVMIVVVVSIFVYIFITLTILIFLLPELHQISGSVEIEDQKQLKG